jgi:hypothetical protein
MIWPGGRRMVAGLMLAGVVLGADAAAHARSSSVVSYAVADVWPAALRFLRVDRDYTIKEKDEAAGYILFELTENKRPIRAALELVKTTDSEGRSATQLIVTIQELPRHYEVALLDKLTGKLREERGPPPPPPPPAPAAPKRPTPPAMPDNPGGKSPADGGLPRPPIWGPEVR